MNHLYEIETLAKSLMAQHGLTGWRFRWTSSRRTAGNCNYTHKVIGLSKPLMTVWTIEAATGTILHEIAHALTPGHKHDYVWVMKCREIGGDGKRCWSEREGSQRVAMKYKGVCPNGHKSGMMKMPVNDRSCGKCSRRFNRAFLITWSLDPEYGAAQTPRPTATRRTFATAAQTQETPKPASGKAPRCHAPMPGGKVCNRVHGHTRGHDAR